MIFKRRRKGAEEDLASGAEDSVAAEEFDEEPDSDDELEAQDADDESADDGDEAAREVAGFDRSDGPYDVTEVDADAMAAERIDLGGLQIPLAEGLEIRVEVDQESNTPVALTLIRGQGAVQVTAFAAPRSGGAWGEALIEISREFTEQGGTVDEADGPFGTELRTMVAGTDEQGRNVVQPIRFVGVEGPRWLLRGVLFGEGTVAKTAGGLEELFRSVVVVRGEAAMRPGAPLPLTLPEQVPQDVEAGVEGLDDDYDEDEPDLPGGMSGPNGGPPGR